MKNRIRSFLIWLMRPNVFKGVVAISSSIAIFVYPENAIETVTAFLALYGIVQTAKKNEDG